MIGQGSQSALCLVTAPLGCCRCITCVSVSLMSLMASLYAGLMSSVKRDLVRDRPGVTNMDAANFFCLASFFVAYQRYALEAKQKELKASSKAQRPSLSSTATGTKAEEGLGGEGKGDGEGKEVGREEDGASMGTDGGVAFVGGVAATLDEETFRLVLSRWSEFADGSKTEKQWANLSAAGSALKEMVRVRTSCTVQSKSVVYGTITVQSNSMVYGFWCILKHCQDCYNKSTGVSL